MGALVPDFEGKSYLLGGENSTRVKNSQHTVHPGRIFDIKNIFDYIFTGKKLNYSLVKKYYFFLEACEYERHFLNLTMDVAIITNLELEHTDYFRDWNDYESAFLEMIEKLKGNVLVLPDLKSEKILQHPKTIVVQEERFDFQHIWGEHQQKNASLVFGLLSTLLKQEVDSGLPHSISDVPSAPLAMTLRKAIEQFRGIWRRMEALTTTKNGTKIFSDYGHVASSLEVGLKALREKFPGQKITCIFQPHQMHRILMGWDAFPKALEGYDQTFIYDIYAARERIEKMAEDFKKLSEDYGNIASVEDLGNVFAQHCGSRYLKTFEEIEEVIEKVGEDEVIVVYSAGDIDYRLRQYLGLM